ncbi:MAG: flagellar motor switch protein FliG [Pseudomonadales bacterium]|nr:flagellar motor switch protein FliG [Pseudomonadales bacterium]
MADSSEELDGAKRAAVFLLSLGEDAAANVLKHMEPREVQSVGQAMAELTAVSNESLTSVVGTFLENLSTGNAVGSDPANYVRSTLNRALGETKGNRMANRILQGKDFKGMDTLKWMDAESVGRILKHEHPQICAIVLSSLDDNHAAEVLSFLPVEGIPDIMMRIANLDEIHPAALAELDDLLQRQVVEAAPVQPAKVEGMKIAAGIIGYLDSNVEAEVLDRITEEDEDMGNNIRDLMFIFDNLLSISDRDMQRLLQEAASDKLVIALKGASEEMKTKIISNMSSRASEMLLEDLELKGPVRLSEVEDVQKEILQIAINLAADGTIVLGGKGGDEYV